jgi:2-iminobutanoate/2-iminopropanoate deaminase
MSDARKTIDAEGAPDAIGPYNHAVAAAGLLFCSGQVPLDPESGEIVGETPAEQATQCLKNLQAVCEAAGTELAKAVRMTIFTTQLEEFASINEAYADLFPDDPPARAAVGVAALPKGALVEIDAVVALDD